jgi:drug/metabolite transporter (DMT)-like permease
MTLNIIKPKVPSAVFIGLVLAIVLDTVVQISWKMALSGIPENASALTTTLRTFSGPFFYVAMAAFAAQFFNWMRVLARADLSFAQPITALSYVSVLTLSSHSLHERISLVKILGIMMILLGIFLITRTPYRTAPPLKNS